MKEDSIRQKACRDDSKFENVQLVKMIEQRSLRKNITGMEVSGKI